MFAYQHPSATMTLREALAELRAAEADVSQEVSTALATALEAHDVVHILFGLDISDLDEIVAHGWMLVGTTLTAREMHAVTLGQDHRRFADKLGHATRIGLLLRAAPRLAAAALRARGMTKLWPWAEYVRYLDVPLNRIRSEYGIKLPPPRATSVPRPRGPHHLSVTGR